VTRVPETGKQDVMVDVMMRSQGLLDNPALFLPRFRVAQEQVVLYRTIRLRLLPVDTTFCKHDYLMPYSLLPPPWTGNHTLIILSSVYPFHTCLFFLFLFLPYCMSSSLLPIHPSNSKFIPYSFHTSFHISIPHFHIILLIHLDGTINGACKPKA
jgi:hypothetical protein